MNKNSKLKLLREKRGFCQDRMAKLLNLSHRNAYSRKELGIIRFSNKEILEIQNIFELTNDEVYEYFIKEYKDK